MHGGGHDIEALERLREPARSLCFCCVKRFRREPQEFEAVEQEASVFLAKLDAAGLNDLVSWLDLCGPLKLRKAPMDHDHKRFGLWVLKRRGGLLAQRLAVDSTEFRALEAAGWREAATHE